MENTLCITISPTLWGSWSLSFSIRITCLFRPLLVYKEFYDMHYTTFLLIKNTEQRLGKIKVWIGLSLWIFFYIIDFFINLKITIECEFAWEFEWETLTVQFFKTHILTTFDLIVRSNRSYTNNFDISFRMILPLRPM